MQAHGSLDVPALPPSLVPDAGAAIDERGIGGIDVVRALAATGYDVEAERVLEMLRQRLLGDYLQTAAIFDEDVRVQSNLSDPNDYAGPGTGYRMGPERRAQVARVRQERTQDELLADQLGAAGCLELRELGPAAARVRPDEIVIGVSPAFAVDVWRTLGGLTVAEALRQVLAGLEEEGAPARLVRVQRSLDVGMIGWAAARLAGSGVGIGLQGKGTALIHRADLPVLANLELLPNAPLIDAALYRGLGRNAARYARGARRGTAAAAGVQRAVRPALPRARRGAGGRGAPPLPAGRPGRAGGVVAELRVPLTYPLSDGGRDAVHTASGRTVADITLDGVVAGEIGAEDLRVGPETLLLQAEFAEQGGNEQLADNLRRGAELVAFGDDELLQFYDALRPGRSTAAELDELAARLEARDATRCAALVREARAAYVRRGLIT